MPKSQLSGVPWPRSSWMLFTFQPALRALQQPHIHTHSSQLTTPNTGREMVIDIAISSTTQLKNLPPLRTQTTIKWNWKLSSSSSNCTKAVAQPVWRYSQADFNIANELLAGTNWEQLLKIVHSSVV